MYHTFQSTSGDTPDTAKWPGKAESSQFRRISTTNACLECRRRKIRCDGNLPCSQCHWYRRSETCRYTKPTQRVVPSRALVEKLTNRVTQTEALLNRIFPGHHVESLLSLSHEDLLNLALNARDCTPQSACTPHSSTVHSPAVKSDTSHDLESLEQTPAKEEVAEEFRRHLVQQTQRIADDVNGLSLAAEKQSSYAGISSIAAALHTIFTISPSSKTFVSQWRPIETALPSRARTPSPIDAAIDASTLPTFEEGKTLLDAYFTRIHALMPMVDEQGLWQLWTQGTRQDAPYLALLNTILALGALVTRNSTSNHHTVFFRRAMHHINIELLGSGSILAVQAIGLMSGYYLHYVNRPNLANNLMGAAIRMATVLGMHREAHPRSNLRPDSFKPINTAEPTPTEMRRRTWWTLFNLDTWANTTQGRPSFGRLGNGVSVRPPQVAMEKMDNVRYQEALKMLPLIHSTAFSKIATRIQDTLAAHYVLSFEDISKMDKELVLWHEGLPSILNPTQQNEFSTSRDCKRRRSSSNRKKPCKAQLATSSQTRTPSVPTIGSDSAQRFQGCPDFLKTARLVMHFRYQNLRMLLHRPALLSATLRSANPANSSTGDQTAIAKCRTIAAQTICDISTLCEEESITAWNGVWFMYQATMVPLVSLFAYLNPKANKLNRTSVKAESDNTGYWRAQPAEIQGWESQVQMAIAFFNRIEPWSMAANKSRDVVLRLYEAYKHLASPSHEPGMALIQAGQVSTRDSCERQHQDFAARALAAHPNLIPATTGMVHTTPPHLTPASQAYIFPPTLKPLHNLPCDQSSLQYAEYMPDAATYAVPEADFDWPLDNFAQDMQWDPSQMPIIDSPIGFHTPEGCEMNVAGMLNSMAESVGMDDGWC
ncbi:hypothetical protein K461DRAFT_232637 [Myriangium duriaei CBS 260.36]|uniref:Zn(2)-C6 fungal-type domain-containing protein n=1 Tax=Myriangium duriaei CBS 260.36 TaxID=1168546 RepID=A0A9P4IQX3_9PEZI|nr:hypothetical protein K461DRAFT_232637 [Myriangium duriaei CBS 260.36]